MDRIKRFLSSIPVVGPIARRIYHRLRRPRSSFHGSRDFWIRRYANGGNSGPGSYDRLAEFKAEVLNDFVTEKNITTVIDYGCGDGNQLSLAKYPAYIGFDVSPKAISLCREKFAGDRSKTFKLMDEYAGQKAECTLSLDVIFHLVEEPVFVAYMERLFDSSTKFVVIYASDLDEPFMRARPQLKQRKFSSWIQAQRPRWELIRHIPNKYPLKSDPHSESISEFYIYQKR